MQGPWPPRLTIHLHLGRATGQPLGCFRQILLREFYYVICNNLWVCMYRCLVFLVALPLLVTACKREENNALQMMSDSSTTSVEKQIRDRFGYLVVEVHTLLMDFILRHDISHYPDVPPDTPGPSRAPAYKRNRTNEFQLRHLYAPAEKAIILGVLVAGCSPNLLSRGFPQNPEGKLTLKKTGSLLAKGRPNGTPFPVNAP
jgi:hypothetical protein